MLGFLARKVGFAAVMLAGILVLTFILSRALPGDPARLIAGPRANAAAIEHVRVLYQLDQPLTVQFIGYVGRLAKGDLGTSIVTRRPVLQDIAKFFPATLELVLVSLFFSASLGVTLGLLMAIWKNTIVDFSGRILAVSALSLPDFWIGILAQLLFFSILTVAPFGGRLPVDAIAPPTISGLYTLDALAIGDFRLFASALWHLCLPAFVLSISSIGLLARIVRATALEVLSNDYIRVARAKGLKPRRLYLHHVLRNTLLPTVTFMGLLFGLLLSGAVLVELIFAWPGLGRYTASAIAATDYNAIMGVTIAVAIAYVLLNSLIDLLYTRVDPRVRFS